jgi:negative regulator of replication initiation
MAGLLQDVWWAADGKTLVRAGLSIRAGNVPATAYEFERNTNAFS